MNVFKNNKMLLLFVTIALFVGLAILLFFKMCKKQKESFQSDEKKSTLIFFRASWCGHCQRFKPVWDEFVKECNDSDKYNQIDILELDIDKEDSKPLMEKHNVRGFPHVVLTKDNEPDQVFKRNRTKEELFAFLDESLH